MLRVRFSWHIFELLESSHDVEDRATFGQEVFTHAFLKNKI